MALDCASSAPGVFPFTAYSAAVAFPDDAPLMYAMMSVIDPVVAALKYETDWALASFWSGRCQLLYSRMQVLLLELELMRTLTIYLL